MAKRLTTSDFINRLAELNDIESKAAAKRIYNHFIHIITSELSKGNALSLANFGTILTSKVAEREQKLPTDPSQTITIPAHRRPKIRFSSKIKQAVN